MEFGLTLKTGLKHLCETNPRFNITDGSKRLWNQLFPAIGVLFISRPLFFSPDGCCAAAAAAVLLLPLLVWTYLLAVAQWLSVCRGLPKKRKASFERNTGCWRQFYTAFHLQETDNYRLLYELQYHVRKYSDCSMCITARAPIVKWWLYSMILLMTDMGDFFLLSWYLAHISVWGFLLLNTSSRGRDWILEPVKRKCSSPNLIGVFSNITLIAY